MSKRNKSFVYVPKSKEPLTFVLQSEHMSPESFNCVPSLPAGVLVKLGQPPDEKTSILGEVIEFFHMVLDDTDIPRFDALIDSKRHQIPFDTLTEIMEWLLEEYTGRPTEPPSSSEAGRQTTGNGSMDASLPATSTPTTSQPIDSVTTSMIS